MSMLPGGCNIACTACSHRYLSMNESLSKKHLYLTDKLSLWKDLIQPVQSVKEIHRWNYRDRVNLAMQYYNSRWNIGLLRKEILIPADSCPVHTPRVNKVINLLINSLPDFQIFPSVRMVQAGKQLVLILKTIQFPSLEWITESFKKEFFALGMEGLWIHLFPSVGKKVFGKGNWHLVTGGAQSLDENGLWYGPAAFQQLIPELANKALQETRTFLNPSASSLVVDLYSGTGTSLKQWTSLGAHSIGVELFGEAVRFAALNAPKAIILRGTCLQRIPQINQWVSETEEIVSIPERLLYVNPPRTGLEPEISEWISSSYIPSRMAYLSCNALTLRRDLIYLTANGITIEKIIPFDFFPQTRHVETLVLMKREKFAD